MPAPANTMNAANAATPELPQDGLPDDPYAGAGVGDGLSPYEQAEQQARARSESETARRRALDEHRAEVDEACTLRLRRERLREEAERYERDPGYRRRVEAARRNRSRFGQLAFVVALIFIADLFLGTPDLAEELAHSTMSLLPGTGTAEGAAEKPGNERASVATPKWLRLGVGVLLSAIVLVATLLVKKVGDETEHRRAQQRVAPGDREGWRVLMRRIWACRALKAVYMLAMAGFFCWIYTYAHARAEVMDSYAKMPSMEVDFASLGVSLFATGELVTDEATSGSAGESNADAASTNRLALGAAATYTMLWLLHGLLLLLPIAGSTIDRPLASFNPHRAAREAQAMGEREATLLRNIVARIYMTPREDPARETLITLSEPVARAVNELYVREIMPLPDPGDSSASGTVFEASSEEIVDRAPERGVPGFDGLNGHGSNDFGGHRFNGSGDSDQSDFDERGDDPGRIIFG